MQHSTSSTKPAKKKRSTKEYPDIYIPLGEFDRSKLLLQAPRKVGTQGAIKSRFLYRTTDDSGDEILAVPYVVLEGQSCFISTTHPLEEDSKQGPNSTASDTKDLTGYQITYPITSWQTREHPTQAEVQTKEVLDGAVAVIREQAPRFANIKYPGTNEMVFGSKNMRDSLKELDDTRLKPIYDYPVMKDTSGKKVTEDVQGPDGETITRFKKDKSRNQTAYFKMLTFGKNEELVVNSHLYDSEYDPALDPEGTGGELNIADLAGKKGFIDQPTFKLSDAYFGMNPKTDYIAFPQIKFAAGIYEEEERSAVPNFRQQMFSKRMGGSPTEEPKGAASVGSTSKGQLHKLFAESHSDESSVAGTPEPNLPSTEAAPVPSGGEEEDPDVAEFQKKMAQAAKKTPAKRPATSRKN